MMAARSWWVLMRGVGSPRMRSRGWWSKVTAAAIAPRSSASSRAVRSSAYGMDQHSVFSWEIDGGDFVYEEGVSAGAKGTHEVLGAWLASFSDEELPGVVDALFSAMVVSGAQNAGQIFGGGPQAAQCIHEAIRKSDEHTREVLGPALAKLAQIAAERIARGAVAGIAQGFASLFNR